MLIPPGLHFNPLDAAKAVDPTGIKKYDMPYKGQTFVQLHPGGTHVILGTVVGFDIHMDRAGNLLEWRASIECKFTNGFSFSNGGTWRDASEWHPAPAAQQETLGDLRDVLGDVVKRIAAAEARVGVPQETTPDAGFEQMLRDEMHSFHAAAEKDIEALGVLLRKISDKVEAIATERHPLAALDTPIAPLVPTLDAASVSPATRAGRFAKKDAAPAAE